MNYFRKYIIATTACLVSSVAAQDNLAPEQVGGKTLTFHCEKEELVNADSYRDENTYDFLTPGGQSTYTVSWTSRNHEDCRNQSPDDDSCRSIATSYKRTGKNTATVTYTFEFSHGGGNVSSWYTRTYELLFTSPTGGTATCTVTGKPTTIWADKIIYTGTFNLAGEQAAEIPLPSAAEVTPPPSAAGYTIHVNLYQAEQCSTKMYQGPTGYWTNMPRTPLRLEFPASGGNQYTAPHPHGNSFPDINVSYSPNSESAEAYVKVENPEFNALLVLNFTKPTEGTALIHLHEDGLTHHMRHVTFSMDKLNESSEPVQLPAIDDCEGDPQMLDDGLSDIIAGLEERHCASASEKLYRKRLLALLPLIRMSGDPNRTLPETKGNTALHYACSMGHVELVQWLVNHGADTEAVTNKGATVDACIGSKNGNTLRSILQQARENPVKQTPEQAAGAAGQWLEQAFACKDISATSKISSPDLKAKQAAETLFRFVATQEKHPFGVDEFSRMGRLLTWAFKAELTEKEFVDTVMDELHEARTYWKKQRARRRNK